MTTDARDTYSGRLQARLFVRELERRIAFGYTLGMLALLLGGARWLLASSARDGAMLALFAAGGALVLVTLVAPTLLGAPERAWRALTGRLAELVLVVILLVVYVVAIVPVGWLRRRLRGSAPFHSWTGAPPPGMEGWTPLEPAAASGSHPPTRVRLLAVLAYMIRRRQYLLIPTCMLLIVLGLVLFFVQTSTLAPLIYTLF